MFITLKMVLRWISVAMVIAKVSGTSTITSISSTNHQYTVLSQTYSALSGLRGGEYGALYSSTLNKQSAQEYCIDTFSCFAGVTVVLFLIHARCHIHSIPMIMHKCMLFFSDHGFHFSTFCLSYFVDVLSINYHLNTAVLMDYPCRTPWIALYILMKKSKRGT